MDFLKYIISPTSFSVIIIVCFFIFVTRGSWKAIIKKGGLEVKNKFFSFNSKEEKQGNAKESAKLKNLYKKLGVKKIDDLYTLLETTKKSVEESKNQQNNLFLLWRQYMFLFFNVFLVPRSKLALAWLNNNPNSTKEMLLLSIIIPPNFGNPDLEREAVFNALISHSLIQKNERELYTITNIGIDFLKFIGLLN